MAEFITGMKRTNYCTELSAADAGKRVTVNGWVQKTRNLGSLVFVDLRDRSGIVQLVFDSDTDKDLFDKAESLRAEYVLAASGVVRHRSPEAVNSRMATGEIEIAVDAMRILNGSETPPFHIDDKVNVSDALRLKYRYLDLRRPSMSRYIMMRHRIVKEAHDYFDKQGFIEVETPSLCKSTPEGARDYLVPSRVHPGKFYALPQSPQLFKQLLMCAGFDRYMQIAKCYRDEDLRADRQPEFTQIDLEMSFVDADDVMTINEGFIKRLFKNVLDIDVPTPFVRMPYSEAMARFGSDKPDVRFGLELKDISEFARGCGFKVFSDAVNAGGAVRLICAPAGHYTRKEIDGLTEFIKTHGGSGMAWIALSDAGEPGQGIDRSRDRGDHPPGRRQSRRPHLHRLRQERPRIHRAGRPALLSGRQTRPHPEGQIRVPVGRRFPAVRIFRGRGQVRGDASSLHDAQTRRYSEDRSRRPVRR